MRLVLATGTPVHTLNKLSLAFPPSQLLPTSTSPALDGAADVSPVQLDTLQNMIYRSLFASRCKHEPGQREARVVVFGVSGDGCKQLVGGSAGGGGGCCGDDMQLSDGGRNVGDF
jgi:hypothetical protein